MINTNDIRNNKYHRLTVHKGAETGKERHSAGVKGGGSDPLFIVWRSWRETCQLAFWKKDGKGLEEDYFEKMPKKKTQKNK